MDDVQITSRRLNGWRPDDVQITSSEALRINTDKASVFYEYRLSQGKSSHVISMGT